MLCHGQLVSNSCRTVAHLTRTRQFWNIVLRSKYSSIHIVTAAHLTTELVTDVTFCNLSVGVSRLWSKHLMTTVAIASLLLSWCVVIAKVFRWCGLHSVSIHCSCRDSARLLMCSQSASVLGSTEYKPIWVQGGEITIHSRSGFGQIHSASHKDSTLGCLPRRSPFAMLQRMNVLVIQPFISKIKPLQGLSSYREDIRLGDLLSGVRAKRC